MSLRIQRSDWFMGDLEHYAAWYDREANWDVAERFLQAVTVTLSKLAKTPDLGRRTSFAAKELQGLRCITVEKPFQKHLLFYRHDATTVYAERAVHGARDLPIRLTQQLGLEGE